MELALLLAAGLRDWVDFGVIAGILLLNAAVGWYQEKQAADVVASLKGDIAMKATVVRDGREIEIKARELVPGDIVSTFPTPLSLLRSIDEVKRPELTSQRSLLRTAKLSLLMRDSSAVMMTPMATRRICQSSKRAPAPRPARKVRTMAVTMMRLSRSTVQAMRSSLSISLP